VCRTALYSWFSPELQTQFRLAPGHSIKLTTWFLPVPSLLRYVSSPCPRKTAALLLLHSCCNHSFESTLFIKFYDHSAVCTTYGLQGSLAHTLKGSSIWVH
jgi:hypothetical protein